MITSYIKEEFREISENYAECLRILHGSSILVTGATGMITSYFINFLLSISDEYELNIYAHCRNKNKALDLFGNHDRLHILLFDINSQIPEVGYFDYIVHGASYASTKYFIESPVDVIKPNVLGIINVLEYCRQHSTKKVLMMSSNSIYGEGGMVKNLLTEQDYGIVDPLGERSCYVESKKMAEQICVAYSKQYCVPSSIIRICHTYGPTFDIANDNRVIPKVIKKIINDEDIIIYKDSVSKVQYTYIADMCAAMLLTLIKGGNAEAYNAGNDELISVDEAIKIMVQSNKNIKGSLVEKDVDENYSFRKGKGINFVKIDNSKLKKLGWNIKYENQKGFSRVLNSYLEQYMK